MQTMVRFSNFEKQQTVQLLVDPFTENHPLSLYQSEL